MQQCSGAVKLEPGQSSAQIRALSGTENEISDAGSGLTLCK